MSRTIIGLVVVGVVVLAVALGIAWQSTQSEKAVMGQPAQPPSAPPTAPVTATTPPAIPSLPAPPGQAQGPVQQQQAAATVMAPTFDVVRVGPDGRAVIAGRA